MRQAQIEDATRALCMCDKRTNIKRRKENDLVVKSVAAFVQE